MDPDTDPGGPKTCGSGGSGSGFGSGSATLLTGARDIDLGEKGTLYLTILVPGKIVVVTGARDIGLGEKRPEGGGGGYSG